MGAVKQAAPVDNQGSRETQNSNLPKLSGQNGQTDRSSFHDDAPPFDSDHRPPPSGHWDDSDNHGHWPPFPFGDNDKPQPGSSDTFVRPMENPRDRGGPGHVKDLALPIGLGLGIPLGVIAVVFLLHKLFPRPLFPFGCLERMRSSGHNPASESGPLDVKLFGKFSSPYAQDHLAKLIIPSANLEITDTVLGRGEHGVVNKGYATGLLGYPPRTAVAVKALLHPKDSRCRAVLTHETEMLLTLGRHVNLVNLLGTAMQEYWWHMQTRGKMKGFVHLSAVDNSDGPVLILELCPNESLRNFLRKQYPEYYYNHVSDEGHLLPFSDQDFLIKQNLMMTRAQPNHHTVYSSDLTTLSTRDLLSYCYQVARGLEYIAAQGVVHRDVAARNVLLSSRSVVKLADFAMAQHCSREGATSIADFGEPMPIKWMAPEAILQKQISEKTDVWAFGILMWEIFTFAKEPYPDVNVKGRVMDFVEKVKQGLRMTRPLFFPAEIFDKVTVKCWELDAAKRPSFSEIRRLLENFIPFSQQAEYLDLNQEYESFNQMFGITNTNVYVDLKYEKITYEAVPKY